jgi:hypothetical protein
MTSEPISARDGATQTLQANPIADLGAAVVALVESNRVMQASLAQMGKRQPKIYVPIPEKFDGKIGDKIDAWLKKFETWYRHREQAEGLA